MDSQERQSVSPIRHNAIFLGAQKCVKIFELDTRFVRLRVVNEKWGGPRFNWLPNWTSGAKLVPQGR